MVIGVLVYGGDGSGDWGSNGFGDRRVPCVLRGGGGGSVLSGGGDLC